MDDDDDDDDDADDADAMASAMEPASDDTRARSHDNIVTDNDDGASRWRRERVVVLTYSSLM